MALIPLKIPPGVYRNGTEYQAKGRYFDSNLVRWFEGTLRPIGGWRKRSETQLTGKCRALLAWRDNSGERWTAAGTHSNLYVMSQSGEIKDITPTGFTSGEADSSIKTGFGYAAYGYYAYGVQRPDVSTIVPATVWTLDTWGEYLIGCSDADGNIYEWQLGFAGPTDAAVVTNAPTSCAGIVVTADRIVMALGAGGNPRKIKWCDQEDNTDWTTSTTNQAGEFELVTSGSLMTGKRVRGLTLLLTDNDVHTASYIGFPYVYSFEKVGSGCGIISKQACVAAETSAIWMSKSGFWVYDGYVKPLPCDVGDFVFKGMNTDQASKIYAVHNSKFGEITWFYPSSTSNENDSYVTFNYREGHWSIGLMARTAGVDLGVFPNPLLVSADGYIYEHDVGFNYDSGIPFAESGPIELGAGDQVMAVSQIIPDEDTLGDVVVSFKSKMYPTSSESSHGPYTASQPTDTRFTARQVKVKYSGNVLHDWRVGEPRLDAKPAGKR